MKYKIYTILISIFSFGRKSEIGHLLLNLDSNENISIDFMLLYLNTIIVYLLYKTDNKLRFLFISILVINMLFLFIDLRLHIGWLHIFD